jgi:hypothetical protein
MAAFINNPAAFDHLPEKKQKYSRPHLTLFFSFLKLLQKAQIHTNKITGRQLDFFYRTALKATPLPGHADQVHLLAKQGEDEIDVLIPAGTLLDAGEDGQGNPVVYQTNEDLVVNKAQVAQMKSLFVVKNNTGQPTWKDMYRIAEAPQFKSQPESKRWKLFGGEPGEDLNKEIAQEARFGWVFCSPHLALSEGKRTITFAIEFTDNLANLNLNDLPFDIEFTTEKKWINIIPHSASTRGNMLTLALTINKETEAITPLEKPDFPMPYPAVRILPKPNERSAFYQFFGKKQLQSLKVRVDVIGLQNLEIQTKEGPQKAYKPFPPFGTAPEKEDALLIFHEELLKGHLTNFKINLNWKNLPEHGFRAYYHHYDEVGAELGISFTDDFSLRHGSNNSQEFRNPNSAENGTFKGKVNLVDRRTRLNLLLNTEYGGQAKPEANLFPVVKDTVIKDDHTNTNDFTIGKSALEGARQTKETVIFRCEKIQEGVAGKIPVKSTLSTKENDLSNRERFIELVLSSQDFVHNKYSQLLQLQSKKRNDQQTAFQNKMIAFNNRALKKIGKKTPLFDLDVPPVLDSSTPAFASLNEPYTPVLKSISVDYNTEFEVKWNTPEPSIDGFCYHIEPFGFHLPLPGKGDNDQQQNYQDSIPFLPNYYAEGTFFIGLSGLDLPQDISFLFQLAPGSANPDKEPSQVQWSYLSEEVRKTIPKTTNGDLQQARLLADHTDGLSHTGLIRLYLPEQASVAQHRMPSGLHWLRLQVESDVDSLCDAFMVATQGMKATWIDPKVPSDHLTKPLPAQTITDPITRLDHLEELIQPFPSFGGHLPESQDSLYIRFSERLRHKGRVLGVWDYERMVLTHFSEVYLAKAYPVKEKPGNVQVVVIPDISKTALFDPFEPKLAVARLRVIQHFLKQRAPVFADIQVKNPRYYYLKIKVQVRFYDQNLFHFYSKRLKKELSAFISPWRFDKNADIVIGGKISYFSIVNFIEHRPYVDFLAGPTLELKERGKNGEWKVLQTAFDEETKDILIKEPDVVLVATEEHEIEPLPTDKEVRLLESNNAQTTDA